MRPSSDRCSSNLSHLKFFIKISIDCASVETQCNLISPNLTFSLIKWWWTAICLVCAWNTWFFANLIADWLLQWMLRMDGSTFDLITMLFVVRRKDGVLGLNTLVFLQKSVQPNYLWCSCGEAHVRFYRRFSYSFFYRLDCLVMVAPVIIKQYRSVDLWVLGQAAQLASVKPLLL